MKLITSAPSSAAFACVALSTALAGAAAADILVVSSSVPGLKPGTQLPDSAHLDVPAGAKVRVMLPSGATLSVNGPANRLVKDVTKGEPIVESVWSKAKELLETGGVDQSRPGATRGAVPRVPAPAPVTGWNVIPATANGSVCVERGSRLVLARPAGSSQREGTIIDTAANTRASVTWLDGAAQADWPEALKPSAATVYQVTVQGQSMRQLRLKLLDKRDLDEANALKSLLGNDCLQQARALTR
jgi:hypothetical protein